MVIVKVLASTGVVGVFPLLRSILCWDQVDVPQIAGVMLVSWSYRLFIYTVSDSFDIQIIWILLFFSPAWTGWKSSVL